MKKVLEVIKKVFAWIVTLLKGEEFTYVFPLAIFALIAFVKWSLLFVIVTAIWSAHIILRTHEEK
jgi:hypothetical protein